MELEEKIKSLIEKSIEDEGYILDEVVYEKEGSNNFLRIIIDKKGVMEVEDCVTVSNIVNPILDKEDPISDSYILDVCSKEKGSEEDE